MAAVCSARKIPYVLKFCNGATMQYNNYFAEKCIRNIGMSVPGINDCCYNSCLNSTDYFFYLSKHFYAEQSSSQWR